MGGDVVVRRVVEVCNERETVAKGCSSGVLRFGLVLGGTVARTLIGANTVAAVGIRDRRTRVGRKKRM